MSFADLGLAPELLANLQRLKYSVATPIQTATIPLILDGHDVLGCAQTGTGKTAAFSLPILQQLLPTTAAGSESGAAADSDGRTAGRRGGADGKRGRSGGYRPIAALVLTPTRELANQIAQSFTTYGKNLGLRQAVIYGGVSANPQMAQLRSGVDIVVATPGRLLDLMGQNVVDLSRLRVLVLDEADQMLDMGFIQPLKRIVSRIPRDRQTLMFSATMPPEIQRLAEQWLQDPHIVQANVVARPPDKIRQSVAFVDQKRKIDALIEYVQQSAGIRQIVFCRTKHGADRLAKQLSRVNIPAVAIHGNKSQNARERALASFSSEEPPILVATDVAARGLHMPGVSHVINYDLPTTPETYVHRIGRTARAGATGESISFCSPDERQALRDIERLIGHAIAIHSLSGSGAFDDDPRPTGRSTGRHTTPTRQPSSTNPTARRGPAPRKKASQNRPGKNQRRSSGEAPAAGRLELDNRAPNRPKTRRPPAQSPRRADVPRANAERSSASTDQRQPSGQRPQASQRPMSDQRVRSERSQAGQERPQAGQERAAGSQRPSSAGSRARPGAAPARTRPGAAPARTRPGAAPASNASGLPRRLGPAAGAIRV